jgi:hypothetical protein
VMTDDNCGGGRLPRARSRPGINCLLKNILGLGYPKP